MAGIEAVDRVSWQKTDVKIIPSLVVGLGGTGVGAIRHLKRRVRLDWPGEGADRMPELIQFYGIDSVSYRNGSGMEFIRPGEYGFTGGFDPQRLLREHGAIREWWDFRPGLLPPGVIHLGARQIRALGRMSLFHAFPGVWENLSFKIDRLNTIDAASQVNRYGFDIPVETSARQVVIVSSICGGTGAGTFLDVAARIRQLAGTDVKIVAILALPSAFKHTLPSGRQDDRVKANAYAALKEINAFWFAEDSHRFEVRYPGVAAEPHRLEHALFNEIYLIGRQGQGRSLSTLDDVVQQIAHFLYLTTMHTIADPVGEATVNLDRLRKAYSSFAVGALNLPESKITEALYERLKGQMLRNLVDDPRSQKNEMALGRAVDAFVGILKVRARLLSTDIIGKGTKEFNQRAATNRTEINRLTVQWLLDTIIPTYGLASVNMAKGILEEHYEDLKDDLKGSRGRLADANEQLPKAKDLEKDRSRWNRWRKGEVRDKEDIEEEIQDLKETVAVTQMMIRDGSPDSEPRFLDFVTGIVDAFSEQYQLFLSLVMPLVGRLAEKSAKAVVRASKDGGRFGEGRELRYYDMEVDPSLPGMQDPASLLIKSAIEQDTISVSELYSKDLLYHTLQLLGVTTLDGKQRPGERQTIVDFQQVIDEESGTLLLSRIDTWSVDRLAESLVGRMVDRVLENYTLEALLKQPDRAEGREQTNMKDALRVSVRGVLDNVRPFWGASPYPDEQQLENIRFLSADFDPTKAGGTPEELFREYLDSAKTSFKFKQGANPSRFDALWLQHGAELCHIQEVHDCWDIYRAFPDKEGLHLAARYVDLPEPNGIPRMGPPVQSQRMRRWTLAERARLFDRLKTYAGPVSNWNDALVGRVLIDAQQAGDQDLYDEANALLTAEPELANKSFAELHHRFGASF